MESFSIGAGVLTPEQVAKFLRDLADLVEQRDGASAVQHLLELRTDHQVFTPYVELHLKFTGKVLPEIEHSWG